MYFLPGEAGPPVLAIWSGPGSFSLNFSNATLISPILCLSLKLAVFRRYLDMGAVLGLGFGPRFLGPCLACNEELMISLRLEVLFGLTKLTIHRNKRQKCRIHLLKTLFMPVLQELVSLSIVSVLCSQSAFEVETFSKS